MKIFEGYQDALLKGCFGLIILAVALPLQALAQFKSYSTSTNTGKTATGSSYQQGSSYQSKGGAGGFSSYQNSGATRGAGGGSFGTYQRPGGGGGNFGGQQINSNFSSTRVNPQGFGHGQAKGAGHVASPGGVYQEFKSSHGVIRWLPGQMPLHVWVSNGLAIDAIMDPKLGAPVANVDNVGGWPDLVAQLVSNPAQLKKLPVVQGYVPAHRDAVMKGIGSWKRFSSEGLFNFDFVDNPAKADIHVFFVNHFVNNLAMGLFAGDIRGYTSKRSFPYQAVIAKKKIAFRPVVIVLRCADKSGNPMVLPKMQAAAAHEMGHALGIEGHSPNSNDLMSIYYGNGTISSGDAATIRYLYSLTPDLVP